MTKNKKTYILDTNVLIQSAKSIERFEENDIIIPLPVLEELDSKKKEDSEVGRNAREAIRALEALRETGSLMEGVLLPTGGTLKVVPAPEDVSYNGLSNRKTDNQILSICAGCEADNKALKKNTKVILVSKDILLRVKAEALGLTAEDFLSEKVVSEAYTGRITVFIPEDKFRTYREDGVPASEVYTIEEDYSRATPKLYPNQFVILTGDQSMQTQLGKVYRDRIIPLDYEKATPYDIHPRNVGQTFFQEALMQPADVAPCVIATGPAGSAKTFYSLAVGLDSVYNSNPKQYRRILVCRPNASFEAEGIGYLPGDENEKIAPLMRPIIDNLEILLDSNENERYRNEKELSGKIEEIFERQIIRTEALNYIRGRSLVNTFLIIDEAQNITPAQAKGILTRAGKGTKIILLGDPKQIDKPYLDEKTNGLTYAMDRMKNSPLAWQIALEAGECERSALAMDAAKRL